MNLLTIPPHVPMLPALAADWLARAGDDPLAVARGLILLPTRRAARALAEAFLQAADGRPLLLPRIAALGALDEAPLALAGVLDLPPAVEPAQRLAVLTRLILALDGRAGAPRSADRAWRLAEELGLLMDTAERAGIDLAQRLPDAADAVFAQHWGLTLDFLTIVTRAWPDWLAEQGLANPAARQVALLHAQARAWQDAPPAHPVLVAGTTGGIPAVAALLGVVARLKHGRVVLPGLDLDMPEAVWASLDETHPQAGLQRLLAAIGAARGDVAAWPATEGAVPAGVSPGRAATIGLALLPAVALDRWRQPAAIELAGVEHLRPADEQEEALAIALTLRDALETPGARAALVTPDRRLAGRVAAELLRFGIIADDSAGEPLIDTPPAVFLRLLAQAMAEQLAPVPLLALLKHPLAGAGLAPSACRAAARALEMECLRGPRPVPGLAGLRRAVQGNQPATLVGRMEACLETLLRIVAVPRPEAVRAAPVDLLAALVEAAEALAATDDQPGPARLWAGEEGEALAARLAAVIAALPVLPDQSPACLPGLLDAALAGAVVRSRRAVRGRGGVEHPRCFIWGLLEARLQAVDLVVLGGLTEATWPPATEPGPWLSRPMRARVGLPSPEEAVGQAAHDFVATICAAPRAVLSAPARRDRAPAVPARWLVRLAAFLGGQSGAVALAEHPGVAWARALDQPAGPPRPVAPPRPCPPLSRRPRKLSVTAIEAWIRDPYAIHAKHILRLRALDPLDQATDAADFGTVVHAALHGFLTEHGARFPPDAAARLRTEMERALLNAGLRPALLAWWQPRLARIADWVADTETQRRREAAPAAISPEVAGTWTFQSPAGAFTLTGRADRIEQYADGTLSILDYKTGTPPAASQVEKGQAPQLPLEAVMAGAGAFGADLVGVAGELAYWHLTGRFEPGEVRSLGKKGRSVDPDKLRGIVADAEAGLRALVARFDHPDSVYLAQPHPGLAPRFSDYTQLARVAEWAAAAEAADDDD